MFTLSVILADGIRIDIGDFHLVLTVAFLLYLLIAALVGIIAEFIVGWRLPFGFVGAIIAALIGIWFLTAVVPVVIFGDPHVFGVPIFKALIGAILLVAIWHLLTYRAWYHRRRYYRRY